MLITQSQNLKIRLLLDEDDQLLVRWLSNPLVLEYYEGRDKPHDVSLVRQHFYEDRDRVTSGIIQYQDQDIGYIQIYPIDSEEEALYGFENTYEVIYGMDQFIGETEYWNKGVGTELIEMMIKFITGEKNATRIVIDPQTWNKRAIRVYEKCGFTKQRLLPKHEWHEGEYRDCWLMVFDQKDRVQTVIN
ncbi:GNAT family N-acetyltransferase [Paenibacillus sp. sgz500958]|uniref:GNAT family N-acetyltransferase n=1 Tax=Paenibacillus sp. sgz500958 TaxID=3242475 RepID=UPI0036D37C60